MTNNLTNDMTRLCGEIAALRGSRADLMSNLAETRAEMQAAVAQTVAGFGEARSEMAKQTKAELSGFVVRVKEAVTELRQQVARKQDEFREDITGAQQAWHGTRPAPRHEPAVARPGFQEQSEDLAPKAKKKKR
jgi:predicted  nucleic acid-binding Zn-ribbon protein